VRATTSKPMTENYAHATHFVVLFVLAGSYLLLRTRDVEYMAPLFASGLCFGLAFIMKQHAALLIVFALMYLASRLLRTKASGKKSLAGITLFLLGTIIPYALILLFYAKAGLFEQLWFWTVQYAREHASTSGQTLAQGLPDFTDACGYLFSTQPLLWLLAGTGAVFLCTGRGSCADRPFLLGFFLFSFLSICPGFYFRRHYFIMLLPAVALLSGASVFSAGERLSALKWGRYRHYVPLFLFMTSVAYGLYHEKNYFFLRTPLEVSRSLYGANPFPEALQVARYLKDHTTRIDEIKTFKAAK
jgi:hypothetical protein